MQKRVLALLIALCLVVGLVPVASAAEVASGTCAENLTWVLTDDGTLTISGVGEMEDYLPIADDGETAKPTPWEEYETRIGHIDVQEGITSIGDYTFWSCGWDTETSEGGFHTSLTVSLPSTLKRIGAYAFYRCDGLREIDVPDSVEVIEPYAFMWANFTRFEFPENLTIVEDHVLFECRAVKEIILHDRITEIGSGAFAYCGIKSIVIPESVERIEDAVFMWNSNLEEITILNPDCEIDPEMYESNYPVYDENDELIGWQNATIYGYAGSTAETYAKEHNCPFVPLEEPVENPFTDVPADSFYHEPVLWAVENGITSGATETTFNPDGDCLRAQVVTFLWRAEGEPKPVSESNPFVDVKETDFYYDAVLWAVENGITNGADATHFNPMGVCNRAQVVTFLHRAFEEPAVEGEENPFTDVAEGAWYTEPVLWAVENGVTNGLSATEFGPNADCNRAQIVTFLYRAYNE